LELWKYAKFIAYLPIFLIPIPVIIVVLHRLKKVLNEDIKEHAKFEWRKVKHLEKMKIDALKNQQEQITDEGIKC